MTEADPSRARHRLESGRTGSTPGTCLVDESPTGASPVASRCGVRALEFESSVYRVFATEADW